MKGKISQHKQIAMGGKPQKLSHGGTVKATKEKPDTTAYQKYGSGFRKVKSGA
jgi:hypothetical protein